MNQFPRRFSVCLFLYKFVLIYGDEISFNISGHIICIRMFQRVWSIIFVNTSWLPNGVSRTLSNIWDGAFCEKTGKLSVNYMHKQASS